MNKLTVLITTLLILGAAFAITYFFFPHILFPTDTESDSQPISYTAVSNNKEFVNSLWQTDYEQAAEIFDESFGDDSPKHSDDPDELARAKNVAHWVSQRADPSISTTAEYIDAQKAIAADESVTPRLRARALYNVATMYCAYGRDPELLPIIYADEYYEYFEKAGKHPSRASFRLVNESYNMYPNARAAMNLSHWYVKELMFSELSEAERAEYLTEAKLWLRKGDEQAEIELDRTKDFLAADQFVNTRRYADYSFWRAFVIGGLALVEGGEYLDQYEQSFTDLFALLRNGPNQGNLQYLPYAHWTYGYLVHEIEGNRALAVEQIEKAVDVMMNDIDEPQVEMVSFLANESKTAPEDSDIFGRMLVETRALSPTFDAFVQGASQF